jgi:hypothetical protein
MGTLNPKPVNGYEISPQSSGRNSSSPEKFKNFLPGSEKFKNKWMKMTSSNVLYMVIDNEKNSSSPNRSGPKKSYRTIFRPFFIKPLNIREL